MIDPRKLRPAQLVRLLNSTPLGEVTNAAKLRRHRDAAGLRIGDGKHVDLLRYVAWLITRRHESPAAETYAEHRDRVARRQREKSRSGREIGPLPNIVDPERRAAGERDLQRFLIDYFPRAFTLRFSAGHLSMIRKIETAALLSGRFAVAQPRGTGKTTIAIRAVLWSLLYGHHRFAMLISADESKAKLHLQTIMTELRTNERLLDDFPEVCWPIRALEGINNRVKGQLLDGRPTNMQITETRLVMPTVPDQPASGNVVLCGGILSAVRGPHHLTDEGSIIRPTLVLIDDPQTRESASSRDQTERRLEILQGDIGGLAGPDQQVAAVCTCTVIRDGDLADMLLDKEEHPEWRGERIPLLKSLPTPAALELWDKYYDILRKIKDLPDDAGEEEVAAIRAEATRFYRRRRKRMDAGAEATWPERKLDWHASAIQFAMDLYLRDEASFFAEYQNDPLDPLAAEDEFLSEAEISRERISGYARGKVPTWAELLTAFVDVHHRILNWMVVAWGKDFSGSIIDYGVYPEQKRKRWKNSKASPTLRQLAPGAGLEGAIHAGLTELIEGRILPRGFVRDDDQTLGVGLLLIDAGDKTETVRRYIRGSARRTQLMPSFGRALGPHQRPISTYKQQPGETIGQEWYIRPGKGRNIRHVLFDTGFWKTFVHRRLATPIGDRGALTIYGRKGRTTHPLLAEHLTSEKRERVIGSRPVDVWSLLPGRSENHWFDCLVGCAVAASMMGAQISGNDGTRLRRRGRRRSIEYLD